MTAVEGFTPEMNLRELGGYRAKDGRTIRKGLLYRSAALGLLNAQELERFKELGIRTIIDFRSRKACIQLPDPVFENCEQIFTCAAFENLRDDLNDSPREFFQMLIDEDQHGNFTATMISSIQAALVYTNEAYKVLFRTMKDRKVPLLFHCSQGKDRTGIAAILIMLALDIEEDQIRYDYLLSNEYRRSFIDKRMNSTRLLSSRSENFRTAVTAVEGVIPEAVHMILAEILERYGTYENFLFHEYDLNETDLADLRNYYLE